jgi:PadR family transcriptional regulator PadR
MAETNIQFKKGVLELCVLSLLARRDYYGYEIAGALEGGVAIAEGTVYPLLRRLRDEGLVETYLEESQEGPPRKYYRITAEGLAFKTRLKREWDGFAAAVATLTGEGHD